MLAGFICTWAWLRACVQAAAGADGDPVCASGAAPCPRPGDGGEVTKGGGWQRHYGLLGQQQGMLMDNVRMDAYKAGIQSNAGDLQGATVLDVGTGSGVLSHFAAQAGAKKVYAVEASAMAPIAERLLRANGNEGTIEVLHSALEDVELPGPVDALVSEPLGVLLVHERMIEAYLEARDRWLRPGGIMLPSSATISVLPFANPDFRVAQTAKTEGFWDNSDFYGLNLTSLAQDAAAEPFHKVYVSGVDPQTLVATQPSEYHVDFRTVPKQQLASFRMPLSFELGEDAVIDGLACWFDVDFQGSDPAKATRFSTGPFAPLTHWYQASILFPTPLAAKSDQVVTGSLDFAANEQNTYVITYALEVQGTGTTLSGEADLFWQEFEAIPPKPGEGVREYPGYTRYWSDQHDQYFYVNEATGESTWTPEER